MFVVLLSSPYVFIVLCMQDHNNRNEIARLKDRWLKEFRETRTMIKRISGRDVLDYVDEDSSADEVD